MRTEKTSFKLLTEIGKEREPRERGRRKKDEDKRQIWGCTVCVYITFHFVTHTNPHTHTVIWWNLFESEEEEKNYYNNMWNFTSCMFYFLFFFFRVYWNEIKENVCVCVLRICAMHITIRLSIHMSKNGNFFF